VREKSLKYLPLLIVAALVAGGLFLYLGQDDDSEILGVTEGMSSEDLLKRVDSGAPSDKTNSTEFGSTKTPESDSPEPAPDATDIAITEYQEKQEKMVEDFKSEIKLNMTLPDNMIFETLDIQDNMAALYGKHPETDREMAILAAKQTASPKTIVRFLNENKEGLPMLKGRGFKVSGSIQRLNAPKESGLGKVTLIPGGEKSGSVVWAAHVERKDKAGSYLFLIEASPAYFDQNEGGLDALLETMKANP
jgi:hypothetical protein